MKIKKINFSILIFMFLIGDLGYADKRQCRLFSESLSTYFAKEMIANHSVSSDCKDLLDTLKSKELVAGNPEYLKDKCGKFSNAMFTHFDCGMTPRGVVCFREELTDILNSNDGDNYLRALLLAFRAYDHSPKPLDGSRFNVWNWTLKYFKGDQNKALKYMAVLFQDSKKNIGEVIQSDRDNKTTKNFELLQNYFEKRGDSFNFLPEDVDGESEKAYHFYPIAYVATKMRDEFNQDKYASFLPVMFNIRYELFANHNYGKDIFQNKLSDYKMEEPDIYSGFQAYRYFIKNKRPESFSQFKQKTETDYGRYISHQVWGK
jgi:hypothetical protein